MDTNRRLPLLWLPYVVVTADLSNREPSLELDLSGDRRSGLTRELAAVVSLSTEVSLSNCYDVR